MSLKYQMTINHRSWKFLRHGELHNVNAPAMLFEDGDELWFEYGKSHNLNGPAINYRNERLTQYYIRGKRYYQKDYESKVRNN